MPLPTSDELKPFAPAGSGTATVTDASASAETTTRDTGKADETTQEIGTSDADADQSKTTSDTKAEDNLDDLSPAQLRDMKRRLQADYTRKTTVLADERKAVDAIKLQLAQTAALIRGKNAVRGIVADHPEIRDQLPDDLKRYLDDDSTNSTSKPEIDENTDDPAVKAILSLTRKLDAVQERLEENRKQWDTLTSRFSKQDSETRAQSAKRELDELEVRHKAILPHIPFDAILEEIEPLLETAVASGKSVTDLYDRFTSPLLRFAKAGASGASTATGTKTGAATIPKTELRGASSDGGSTSQPQTLGEAWRQAKADVGDIGDNVDMGG